MGEKVEGRRNIMKATAIRTGNGIGLGLAVLVLGALSLAPAMRADDVGQGAARLSSVEGQVRLSQGGQVIADPAVINAPLFAGTRVETGDDGKAEIQFDDGSVARLSPDSALTLTSLGGQGGASIVLEGGLGYFELQGGGQGGQMRVAFGDSVATATGFTVMRIRLDNPPGEVAVFSGNAHLERGNSLAVDLHGGETVALNANDPSQYNLAETIEPDSWDAWNTDRDQALNTEAADQTGAANNFVNNDAPSPAWNDLDANGSWYNVPGEGYIWSPYEASDAGWDPYGNGNWMWTPGYGYIFVSGYSWGYMPYQCGMWNYYDGFGWGWAPGMNVGLRMGGCHPWWGRGGGGYGGLNIGRTPGGYRPIPMPRAPGSIGRMPPKVISVNRGGFGGRTPGVPVRNINTPVQIGGKTVMPLRPMPTHQTYRSSDSGYVYRPAGGYKGTTTPGNYVYGAGPASNVHVSPGGRQSYAPPAAPRYTAIPGPPPPAPSAAAPGGSNGVPSPPTGPGGRPALGGLVSRDYYRYHPDAGVDRRGNGTGDGTGNPGANPGSEQNIHPWYTPNPGAGGSNPRPSGGNPGGGSYNRPYNPGGSAPAPRPSGGGAPSGGGGGAPRGGGAPPSGGGGAPHGGGAPSGGAPHGGNPGHK